MAAFFIMFFLPRSKEVSLLERCIPVGSCVGVGYAQSHPRFMLKSVTGLAQARIFNFDGYRYTLSHFF